MFSVFQCTAMYSFYSYWSVIMFDIVAQLQSDMTKCSSWICLLSTSRYSKTGKIEPHFSLIFIHFDLMQVQCLTTSVLPIQVEDSNLLFQLTFQDKYFLPNTNDMQNLEKWPSDVCNEVFKRINDLTIVSIRINWLFTIMRNERRTSELACVFLCTQHYRYGSTLTLL